MTEKARVDTSKTIVGIFRLKRRKKRLRSERRELLLSRFLLTLLLEDEGRCEGGDEGDRGEGDDEVEGDDRRLVVAVFVEGEVEGENDEEVEVMGSSTSRRRCSLRTSECIFEQCQNRQTKLKIKSQNVLFSNSCCCH